MKVEADVVLLERLRQANKVAERGRKLVPDILPDAVLAPYCFDLRFLQVFCVGFHPFAHQIREFNLSLFRENVLDVA